MSLQVDSDVVVRQEESPEKNRPIMESDPTAENSASSSLMTESTRLLRRELGADT